MLKAAARNGWIDEQRAVMEVITGIRRAGASIIATYHAKDVARWLNPSERSKMKLRLESTEIVDRDLSEALVFHHLPNDFPQGTMLSQGDRMTIDRHWVDALIIATCGTVWAI